MHQEPQRARISPSQEAFRERLYRQYASQHRRVAKAEDALPAARSVFLDSLVRKYFPESATSNIVDLGAGPGALVLAAKRAGYKHIRGIERSPEEVDIAHTVGAEEVELGDLQSAMETAKPQSLDMVCTVDVVEHMDRSEALQLADMIHRALRPGGVWLIHTVNGDSPWFGRVRYGDLTHEHVYTPKSIYQLLSAAGFSDVTFAEDTPVVHGLVSAVRRTLWLGLRQLRRIAIAVETGEWSRDAVLTQNFVTLARS